MDERIEKLENALLNDSEDDFLFCLKIPLIDRIISKLLVCKKSVQFTKFDGLEDPKMHDRKFQKEVMEYVYDRDMLAKLFLSSLKDDALKWYFSILEKSIDMYKYLIHNFLKKFKYSIIEKVQFKYLCKIKQLLNQYLSDFVKLWK